MMELVLPLEFNFPVGIVANGTNELYVADQFNQTIRKITAAEEVVTTLVGSAGKVGSVADGTGTNANFNDPVGITMDSETNLYVTEFANNTLRKVSPDLAVTTFIGTSGGSGGADGTGNAARFKFPTGTAVDTAGNIYVADQNNNLPSLENHG